MEVQVQSAVVEFILNHTLPLQIQPSHWRWRSLYRLISRAVQLHGKDCVGPAAVAQFSACIADS